MQDLCIWLLVFCLSGCSKFLIAIGKEREWTCARFSVCTCVHVLTWVLTCVRARVRACVRVTAIVRSGGNLDLFKRRTKTFLH